MQIAARKKYDVSDKNYELKDCEIAFSCREACNRTSDCVSNFSILIKSLHSLFLSFLSLSRSISSLSIISYHSCTSRMISISLLLPHERHFWIQLILSYFNNQWPQFHCKFSNYLLMRSDFHANVPNVTFFRADFKRESRVSSFYCGQLLVTALASC